MAKKILAVVLAVMMAVSAMAITAFADQKIDLYPVQYFTRYDANGVNVTGNATWHEVDVTFDIPVYALYGWMTQGNSLEFTLPTYFGDNMVAYPTAEQVAGAYESADEAVANNGIWMDAYGNFYDAKGNLVASLKSRIQWSIIVDGKAWGLEAQPVGKPDSKTGKTITDCVSRHKVVFGAFGRNYTKTDPDDADHDGFFGETTIPQTTVFGSVSSIRLIAKLTVPDTWRVSVDQLINDGANDLQKALSTVCGVQLVDANGEAVYASNSYITDWQPTVVTADDIPLGNTFTFVTDEWDTTYVSSSNFNGTWTTKAAEHPITWDHTLANRAIILGAEGETAKLVVELTAPIVGSATYTLWARTENAGMYPTSGWLNSGYTTWWKYDGSRKYVNECKVDGKVEQLVFDVPVSVLYDATGYGTYNTEFVIFENITLKNDLVMKDYLHLASGWDDNSAINLGKMGGGSVGRISWKNSSGSVLYDGEQVRYAAGGATDPFTDAHWANIEAWLTANPTKWDGSANTEDDACNALGYAACNYIQSPDPAPVEAAAMYLLFPEAAQEEVKAPTEPPETEEDEPQGGDDMNVADEPAEEPKADENPKTGLALAVVPMMIAAAAAVVSKKH